ncbi:MAG TPA: CehA/McbA family metallohydrolase [Anaerolineaceae bacterium]|nr:CehA/McbA family metallohydrolase [Anaerolineaceae bacterium]
MKSQTISLSINITPEQQGTYFTIPLTIPDGIAALTLSYRYDRHLAEPRPLAAGGFTAHPEVNIIDLGLIAPDGTQVGASGSDKTEIMVSETTATPGYSSGPITPGQWQILVGAYKVAPQGVQVQYEVRLDDKERQLLKGDLHTHTLASDGVHTPGELALKARRHGLQFVAITDHNQMISRAALPDGAGVTLIPGVEWTHYQGHANFLGVDQPYDGPFATNTLAEARALFQSARDRGALIVINHPCDPDCGFNFDLQSFPYDCLEVWNGPMREPNLRAVGLWHQLLCTGLKIPICGGSDYHRDTPFIFLGGPTMCVQALSAGTSDILAAVRAGHGFITYAPNGPILELTAADSLMGDTVAWPEVKTAHIKVQGLAQGDVVRAITAQREDVVFTAPADGEVSIMYTLDAPGFVRVDVLRAFLPGLPMLPALISNPIYFEGEPNSG